MKYFYTTLFSLTLLFGVCTVHAASTDCSSIADDATYTNCCVGGGAAGDPNTCLQYQVKSCKVIDSDQKYNMCGCIGASTDTVQCVAYKALNTPTSQQIGGTASSPGTAPSTSAVNSYTDTSYAGNPSTIAPDQAAVKACSAIQFNTILDIAIWAKCIIGAIVIPGIFTLAFVVFLWGVFKFVRSSEQKDKEESKQFIYMGLIGLFVMVSVWGIIKILNTTLGINSTVPTLQTDYLNPSNASKKSTTTAPATNANNPTTTTTISQ